MEIAGHEITDGLIITKQQLKSDCLIISYVEVELQWSDLISISNKSIY